MKSSQRTAKLLDSKVFIAAILAAIVLVTTLITYRILDAQQSAQKADAAAQTAAAKTPAAQQTPNITVSEIAGGLDHPWEIGFLPSGAMIVSERAGVLSKFVDGQKTEIIRPFDVAVRGEGGLLGLAIDPQYASNHFIYSCYNSTQNGGDVRVVRRQLDASDTVVVERADIVTGIPTDLAGTLRHSGCRLAFGPDGNLWIGTGDAAIGGAAQDPKSLAGKILRVDRNGTEVSGNLGGDSDLRVFSVGHRNIQGIAFYEREVNGSWGITVEHGTNRSDEINALKRGHFGWAPPTPYSEVGEMTDLTIPNVIKPIWASGQSDTIAPSAATFLKGEKWGAWQNRLAVAVLKGKMLMIMDIADDKMSGTAITLLKDHGRLRAAQIGPDGSLYVTTDNGSGADKILKLTPTLQ